MDTLIIGLAVLTACLGSVFIIGLLIEQKEVWLLSGLLCSLSLFLTTKAIFICDSGGPQYESKFDTAKKEIAMWSNFRKGEDFRNVTFITLEFSNGESRRIIMNNKQLSFHVSGVMTK